ncbi:MAG: malectin [Bacteroidota bacterium]
MGFLLYIYWSFSFSVFGQPSIWLEAECGKIGKNWLTSSDLLASGQRYITYVDGHSYSVPPVEPEDQVVLPFDVEIGGYYTFWGLAKAPEKNSNSVWLKVDNSGWIRWKTIPRGDRFQWVLVTESNNQQTPLSLNLSAGSHTLTISYREAKAQLDKFFITSGTTSPEGLGEGATNCPPDNFIWLEAECASQGESWINIPAEQASQGVALANTGPNALNSPSGLPEDKLTFTLDVEEAASYEIHGRVSALSKEASSIWIRSNNENWVPWSIGESPESPPTEAPLPGAGPTGGLPVIPDAAGWGINTPAGRGGRIMRVTNLKDSGRGSLRACVEAQGSRVCVFEVSGLIKINNHLKVKNPYLTVAGQTAPSPGILVYGHDLRINTHDVLIQHIGVRRGEIAGEDGDALTILEHAKDVVIDHLSLGWGTDENFDVAGDAENITVRNCLVTEPLNAKGHGFGALLSGKGSVSVISNVFAHSMWRYPLSRMQKLVWANNIHYNRVQKYAVFSNCPPKGPCFTSQNTIIGNIYLDGPSTRGNKSKPFTFTRGDILKRTKFYFQDNYWRKNNGQLMAYHKPRDYIDDQGGNYDPIVKRRPVWPKGLEVLTKEADIMEYVLSQAGARPGERNYLDQRTINQIKNRSGKVIDCVKGCEVNAGGTPSLASNRQPLNLPLNPHGDEDKDGYTNLEEWLHHLARKVENLPTESFGYTDPSEEEIDLTQGYSWHPVKEKGNTDKLVLEFQKGTNILEIAPRETGLVLDKLYLTKYGNSPVNKGAKASNCKPAPEEGPVFSAIRINTGGRAYTTQGGKTFQADDYLVGNSQTYSVLHPILNTADQMLYQTERWGVDFGYAIPLPNGPYLVNLSFAEIFWEEPGKRVFSVSMEGYAVLEALDIYQEAGGNSPMTKSFQVQVTDGTLNIDFFPQKHMAKISTIEIMAEGI